VTAGNVIALALYVATWATLRFNPSGWVRALSWSWLIGVPAGMGLAWLLVKGMGL
jgi:hypothetical protein